METIYRENPIFDGWNRWFPVKIFPSTNPPRLIAAAGAERLWVGLPGEIGGDEEHQVAAGFFGKLLGKWRENEGWAPSTEYPKACTKMCWNHLRVGESWWFSQIYGQNGGKTIPTDHDQVNHQQSNRSRTWSGFEKTVPWQGKGKIQCVWSKTRTCCDCECCGSTWRIPFGPISTG